MNRTIKFRGRSSKNSEQWVEGDLVRRFSTSSNYGAIMPHITHTNGESYSNVEVDGETVGQFTGLRDKNGKEIYEGDVIDCNMSFRDGVLPHRGEIVWMSKYGTFGTKNQAGETMIHNLIYSSMQVIGNIHDNPELLA